jgi:hypothetical protein
MTDHTGGGERMTATHTPGPWEINDGDGIAIAKVSYFAITAPCTPNVGSGLSREENAANARLIATAPKLLAALKAVTATNDDCPMCDRGRLRNPQKTHCGHCRSGRDD